MIENFDCVCGQFIDITKLEKLNMPFKMKLAYLLDHWMHKLDSDTLNESHGRIVMPLLSNYDKICDNCRLFNGCKELANLTVEVSEYEGYEGAKDGNPEAYYEEHLTCPRCLNIYINPKTNKYEILIHISKTYDVFDFRHEWDNEDEWEDITNFCPVYNENDNKTDKTKCEYGIYYPFCFVKEGCPRMLKEQEAI